MRVFSALLVLAAVAFPVSGAYCANPGAAAAASQKPSADAVTAITDKTMDELFAQLADKRDEAAGQAAEAEIERRWLVSGSDTVDLLMRWASEAVAIKDYARALDFLDAVTVLKPDYAEGWNRRATIFYLRDEYGKAIADLEKVLALDPRHFGALAGLGLILNDIDRKADAMAALQQALALDPYLDSDVQDTIDQLKPAVEGQNI